MKTSTAVTAFAALGQEVRLAIYRALVAAGPGGMAAGAVAEKAGTSPSGLTFHITHLQRAGLVRSQRSGRQILYSADFTAMGDLVDFLTRQCCGGHPEVCRPLGKTKKRAAK